MDINLHDIKIKIEEGFEEQGACRDATKSIDLLESKLSGLCDDIKIEFKDSNDLVLSQSQGIDVDGINNFGDSTVNIKSLKRRK